MWGLFFAEITGVLIGSGVFLLWLKWIRKDNPPMSYENILHHILRLDEKDRNEFMGMLNRDVYEIWEKN